MLLPIALMTITWYWTLRAEVTDLIGAVGPVIVGAMVLNTAISLAQLAAGNVEVFGFLPRFWDTPGSVGSVAQLPGRTAGTRGSSTSPPRPAWLTGSLCSA